MYYLCSRKENNNKDMKLIDIFTYTILLGVFLFAMAIFIETSRELWEMFKEDHTPWFRNTKVGMWHNNRKNGVKVLTEREYCNIPKSSKVIYIDKED